MKIEIPGIEIELREGMVYVNGVPHPKVPATPQGAFDLSQRLREKWRPADPIKDVGKRARFWDTRDSREYWYEPYGGMAHMDSEGVTWRYAEVLDE